MQPVTHFSRKHFVFLSFILVVVVLKLALSMFVCVFDLLDDDLDDEEGLRRAISLSDLSASTTPQSGSTQGEYIIWSTADTVNTRRLLPFESLHR